MMSLSVIGFARIVIAVATIVFIRTVDASAQEISKNQITAQEFILWLLDTDTRESALKIGGSQSVVVHLGAADGCVDARECRFTSSIPAEAEHEERRLIAKTRPVLEISRLLLRPPREEDFDAYAETVADPEVMRFLGGPLDRGRAWRVFATMAGHWSLRGYGPFSIIRKSDGRWIGRAGPWTPEGSPGTEVGWLITRQAQGHGYAREAVTAAIDWAFNALDWREVLHCIEPENAPSIRFAESLGASYSRDVRDLPGIGYSGVWRVYAQSRSAWRTRSNAPAP